ncbi:MAG TPA: tRNA lysidine(34) synthetase TilS, partial [Solirubrobacteraceae bacterium]|nr:tRNA lysidine(34) synthetase TilS [Solirubrobacteraceae bacterium]
NYGLRGWESQDDELHCVGLCEQLGVELELVRPGPPPDTGNLQAWARDARYGAAIALAKGLGSEVPVATGHTASDQLETILYRLAASPGRRALLGMSPREGRVVRPLLAFTREHTAAYCRARGLSWREDSSNLDERFARARVRERLVPALLEIHPAAAENVLRTAARLREESELLGELVDGELREGRAGGWVSLDRLRAMHPALARLVMIALAEAAAGDYVPQAGAHVAEILALGERGGRAEVHVGGNVAAVIEGGRVRMTRLPPRRQ